jgi:glycosyltransferase involved in cell wall biosynthesis
MRGETILCIEPSSRWNSLWRDSQQIMSRIAARNRVFFFEPGRSQERSAVAEMVRNLPDFLALRSRREQENLYVIRTPSSLPQAHRHLPRSVLQATMPVVHRINARILLRHVRRAMEAFEVRDPVLWLYSPAHIDLIGKCGEKLACYFNYDEYADFVHNTNIRDLVRRWDDDLARRADVVFATSRAQTERRKALNPNTFFVPNGVDFELFHRALDPGLPVPADIAAIPRPILGFAGWLGYHIDVGLLVRIAEAYGNCRLVLVGPEELPKGPDRRRLRELPNVSFLGRKERTELPNYLKAFDVALMPWSLTGHIRSAYPLKLHEYLAAGRSSVATALPELLPYGSVLRIAGTHEEFLRHIRDALADNGPEAIEARVAVARQNTWDQRVAEIYRILGPLLADRGPSRAPQGSMGAG